MKRRLVPRFLIGATLAAAGGVVAWAQTANANGEVVNVPVLCRIDTLDEIEYFKNGGILHYVLRQLAS